MNCARERLFVNPWCFRNCFCHYVRREVVLKANCGKCTKRQDIALTALALEIV